MAFSCKGGSSDPTGHEIIDGELVAMALPHEQLGSQYSAFVADSDNGLKSIEDRVASATDHVDERGDLQSAGFVKAYDQNYTSSDAVFGGSGGVFLAGTSVDMYGDAKGAQGDWTDQLNDFPNEVGKTDDKGATITSYETFKTPKIADDVGGILLSVTAGQAVGGSKFHATTVFFRRGRIIAGAGIGRLDDKDVQREVVSLAQQLDKRILAVLHGDIKAQGTATPEPTPGPLGNVSPTEALNSFHALYEISI